MLTVQKKKKTYLIMYHGVYSFSYVEIKLSEHRIKDKMEKIRVYLEYTVSWRTLFNIWFLPHSLSLPQFWLGMKKFDLLFGRWDYMKCINKYLESFNSNYLGFQMPSLFIYDFRFIIREQTERWIMLSCGCELGIHLLYGLKYEMIFLGKTKLYWILSLLKRFKE